jgi:hypothetical protein
MRIQLKREGGLAFFPGLSRPRTVELGDLPPEQAEVIERSVRDVRFFEQPPVVGKASQDGADRTRYTLTIEEGGRQHSVQFLEPVEEPRLRALLELVKQAERDARHSPDARG